MAKSANQYQIIDVWAQQPTQRFLNAPVFEPLKRWAESSGKAIPSDIPVQATAGALQQMNMQAMISAWYAPEGDLISNTEVRCWVDEYPEQFYAVCSVDLRDPVKAVQAIRQAVQRDGFKAVRIVQWLWELPCSHALYYPILASCVELDVPICLQVGHTGPLRCSETGRPAHIERIALDFPDLKIVCGHIGYPWHVEMIAVATKFPNVYIDTSAYKVTRYPHELVDYMKSNGKGKVLFGSNFPMLTAAAALEGFESLALDDETAQLFLAGNAKKVFKL